ncbi:MAG: response regulator [Verrucomicrobia bacterium]|nr:response regulator [Verrucomicrobiota bacterium]
MIRKPLRILIVEDEPLARQRLYTLLHMAPGYKVVASAADGRQAVSLVRQHHPEIMLLDIQLPGLNGFEVLSSLRDDPTPPAVILLTAHGDHALRAFDAQVVDYLLKPFTRERLLEALERARAHCAPEDGMITDLEQGEIPRRDRIAVRSGTRSIALPFEEIYYAIADNVHCHIFAAKERARISESLASLHTRLPQGSLRAHQPLCRRESGAHQRDEAHFKWRSRIAPHEWNCPYAQSNPPGRSRRSIKAIRLIRSRPRTIGPQ